MEGQYIPEGALGKVWRVLDRCIMFTTVVGSLASVMFIGAMFLNVIMRYVFSSPIWCGIQLSAQLYAIGLMSMQLSTSF